VYDLGYTFSGLLMILILVHAISEIPIWFVACELFCSSFALFLLIGWKFVGFHVLLLMKKLYSCR
jgi:hypothetical protein